VADVALALAEFRGARRWTCDRGAIEVSAARAAAARLEAARTVARDWLQSFIFPVLLGAGPRVVGGEAKL
jgi:hypothetical protein